MSDESTPGSGWYAAIEGERRITQLETKVQAVAGTLTDIAVKLDKHAEVCDHERHLIHSESKEISRRSLLGVWLATACACSAGVAAMLFVVMFIWVNGRLDKMPPDEWRARVIAIEANQAAMQNGLTRIITQLEKIEKELERGE